MSCSPLGSDSKLVLVLVARTAMHWPRGSLSAFDITPVTTPSKQAIVLVVSVYELTAQEWSVVYGVPRSKRLLVQSIFARIPQWSQAKLVCRLSRLIHVCSVIHQPGVLRF